MPLTPKYALDLVYAVSGRYAWSESEIIHANRSQGCVKLLHKKGTIQLFAAAKCPFFVPMYDF